jgi:hypothetical protein
VSGSLHQGVSALSDDELKRLFMDLGFVTASEKMLPVLRKA